MKVKPEDCETRLPDSSKWDWTKCYFKTDDAVSIRPNLFNCRLNVYNKTDKNHEGIVLYADKNRYGRISYEVELIEPYIVYTKTGKKSSVIKAIHCNLENLIPTNHSTYNGQKEKD